MSNYQYGRNIGDKARNVLDSLIQKYSDNEELTDALKVVYGNVQELQNLEYRLNWFTKEYLLWAMNEPEYIRFEDVCAKELKQEMELTVEEIETYTSPMLYSLMSTVTELVDFDYIEKYMFEYFHENDEPYDEDEEDVQDVEGEE